MEKDEDIVIAMLRTGKEALILNERIGLNDIEERLESIQFKDKAVMVRILQQYFAVTGIIQSQKPETTDNVYYEIKMNGCSHLLQHNSLEHAISAAHMAAGASREARAATRIANELSILIFVESRKTYDTACVFVRLAVIFGIANYLL